MARGRRAVAAAAALAVALVGCGKTGQEGTTGEGAVAGPQASAQRHWTIEDILTAPVIDSVALSGDGAWAFAVIHEAKPELNRQRSILRRIRLDTGESVQVLEGNWIGEVAAIPGQDALSVLADTGDGVQLYRIDGATLEVEALVTHRPTVPYGLVDGTIGDTAYEQPRQVGVISPRWSPDGSMLWYAVAKEQPRPAGPLIDREVVAQFGQPRGRPEVKVEFRVRLKDGKELVVGSPERTEYPFVDADSATWEPDGSGVSFSNSLTDEDGNFHTYRYGWRSGEGKIARVDAEGRTDDVFASRSAGPVGPDGGALRVDGYGDDSMLVEQLRDGGVRNHGRVDFRLDDPRAPGHWLSPDGTRAVFGVRHLPERVRYSLGVLERDAPLRLIETDGSLTRCSFDAAVERGVCVREGITVPPELVTVEVSGGRIARVATLAPRHATLIPPKVEQRTWINRHGDYATGYLMYPRDYVAGKRYPTVVVTHGSDADERFVNQDLFWEYAPQVLAERGYLVVAINDPTPYQSRERALAYQEWVSADGAMPTRRVQELNWIELVHGIEDAVQELVDAGIADPGRLAIAGYSRGSQIANVVMTQSTMFAAASSGDGGLLEPSGYFWNPTYRGAYGGSPYDPRYVENYRRLSPTFRAAQASGAHLQQVSTLFAAQVELYKSLREAGIPAQLSYYRGRTPDEMETHIFNIPSNRVAAMQENLDWFDFWLRGIEDPDATKQARYRRWRAMRDQHCDRLQGKPAPGYCQDTPARR